MKRTEESQKQELLGFIQWKMRNQPEELKEIMPELKKMSLLSLTRWAIQQDIIDA